ncbi:site-specific integrase [Clostridia bacterium]|nr:site-specific integrase [Clostridia bacterium]
MSTTQPIRNPKHVQALSSYFLNKGELRNHLLVILGLNTGLRISDILRLTWNDVYDFTNKCFYTHITLTEQKTGKSKTIAINNRLLSALTRYKDFAKANRPLILSRKEEKTLKEKANSHKETAICTRKISHQKNVNTHSTKGINHKSTDTHTEKAISRQQAYRIIHAAAKVIDTLLHISCHSLRKTFGYLAWKEGISPMIIMDIYNHSSLAVTKRYLGIRQDDLDECYHALARLT